MIYNLFSIKIGWENKLFTTDFPVLRYLKVTLAMGSPTQVAALQAAKMISSEAVAPAPPPTVDAAISPFDAAFDNRFHDSHEFIVNIEKISNLGIPEGRSFGEGDCFIKYSFPTQTANSAEAGGNRQFENPYFPPSVALKSYQTAAVPYIPDPVIGYSTKHSIILPSPASSSGGPNATSSTHELYRQLLHATSAANHSIPVELWCRHHAPGVLTRFSTPSSSDTLLAKGFIGLDELRDKVVNNEGGDSRFKVKLNRVNSDDDEDVSSTPYLMGVVDVGLSYKRQRVDMRTPASVEETAAMTSLNQYEAENQVVPLAVVLHKACGLKTLAKVS